MDKQYLTREKYDTLAKELDFLRTSRRKEVAENLEYAKKLGDLSENAEYHEARERQAEVEDRIRHLEGIMKDASIIEGKRGDTVSIGSSVSIMREGEKRDPYLYYRQLRRGRFRERQAVEFVALGAALVGKKTGDSVKVKTPKGMISYTISEIK